jgi:type II secretory pathway predicted ATPase ExeA
MSLVGEVGSGKTTLLNALIEHLDPSTCIIQIRHTTLDREELLKLILQNLLEAHGPRRTGDGENHRGFFSDSRLQGYSRAELINEFNAFVNGEFMTYQPPPILIIDEAQNLGPDVLEEVRLLTNLENPKSKMLQVVLSGQPELEGILLRSDLRQLRQRIAVHARLDPLTLEETGEYVAFRLECAGSPDGGSLFSEAALNLIWTASKGSPRTINVLCDHALVNAFAEGASHVHVAAAKEAVQDVLCPRGPDGEVKKPRPYLVTDLDSETQSSSEAKGWPVPTGTLGGQRE